MALRRLRLQGAIEAGLPVVAVLVCVVSAQKACKLEGGPCLCKTSNGISLNISSLATKFTQPFPGSDGFNYAYAPCYDQLNLGNLCQSGSGSAGCQGNTNSPYIVTGKIDTASFIFNESTNSMEAMYSDGTDNRKMRVIFTCTNDAEPTITETGENPSLHYNFEVKGAVSCVSKSESGGISPGSILLIIFFVALVLYFIIGVIFMSAMRDAKGSDRIPNRDVWVSLPGLIKDGALYLVSPCQGSGCGSGGRYESL